MDEVKLGSDIQVIAYTRNASGELQDADSTPTYAVYADGVAVLTGQTMTKIATGHYYDQCTISFGDGFAVGDLIEAKGTATVDAVADSGPLFTGRVVAALAEDLPSAATIATAVRDVNNTTPAADSFGAAVNSRLASASYTAPPSAATNASAVRTELATELARVDAATSTRLAAASYTAPPSAASIRTEMDANSTRLANLDATVGSRSVAGDAMTLTSGERTAIANEVEAQIIDDTDSEKVLQAIIDKIAAANPSLDDLTLGAIASAVRTELAVELARIDAAITTRLASASYTAPPSASTNASAVRTELATELGRIDAATSTRLASASYTAPPSAATNASAVRTELSTELARVDVAVSTRATPAQVRTEVDASIAAYDGPTNAEFEARTLPSTSYAEPGDAMTLAASEDVYPAILKLVVDGANDADEYTVQWFKNTTPVSSGITVPTLHVIKRADGTDLIATHTMTQIGSTGAYKYDAVDAERVTAGEDVVAEVRATIDGSVRIWREVLGRDAEVPA